MSTDDIIFIHLCTCYDDKTISYKMKKSQPFSKLFNKHSERSGNSIESLIFLHEEIKIEQNQTPNDLIYEDNQKELLINCWKV